VQQPLNPALLPGISERIRPNNDANVGIQTGTPLFHPSTMIRRQKHSQTQIKRLFKDHPARLRVEKRIWNIDRMQPRVIFPEQNHRLAENDDDGTVQTAISNPVMDTSQINTTSEGKLPESNTAGTTNIMIDGSTVEGTTTPQLTFPPVYTIPAILPNGWFLPMDPKLRPEYPFNIRRTKNKPKDAIGFLPIYTKYRYVPYAILYHFYRYS
jgi:hypothetical protein